MGKKGMLVLDLFLKKFSRVKDKKEVRVVI